VYNMRDPLRRAEQLFAHAGGKEKGDAGKQRAPECDEQHDRTHEVQNLCAASDILQSPLLPVLPMLPNAPDDGKNRAHSGSNTRGSVRFDRQTPVDGHNGTGHKRRCREDQ